MKKNINNIKPATIVRLVVLLISIINLVLSVFGTYQLPGLSETAQNSLAVTITTIMAAISYWYNNSWSENATAADKVLDTLKSTGITVDDLIDMVEQLVEQVNAKADDEVVTKITDEKGEE